MSQNLELKSIKNILEYETFYIPPYQRGYRWDSRQVEDLLQDITEFSDNKKNDNEFYCLQPVVVLPEEDENQQKYRVIDGQQRLTTIYIILKYLKNSSEKLNHILNNKSYKDILEFINLESFDVPSLYNIEYQTREESGRSSQSFLSNSLGKDFNNELDYTNPDFYYMSNAYITISNWFSGKNKPKFLNSLLYDTKVIWYDVSIDNNKNDTLKYEIAIFTRLNIGKISLTNAELIKAMLLIPIENYKQQIEFSTIWDNIEQTLQNNEFWSFLTNENKSDTAIDLIFNILAKSYNNLLPDNEKIKIVDDKFSFYVFDKVLKGKHKSEFNIWEEAKEYFRYLVDWFNHKEIYHKIGYIINNEDTNLVSLIELYKDKTKSIFIKELNKMINLEEINLATLEYKNKKKITKLLLLFNVETILNIKSSNMKFQFDRYKNGSWDIEHIASQTDNLNKEKWVRTVLEYTRGIKAPRKENIKKLIDNFNKYFEKVKKRLDIKDITEENKDNIGNLTLLDSKTNRSYGNAFFPVKRAIIIENDSNGTFIPISTKNIFLKQYTKKLSDMMNWNDDDIKSYRDNIYKLLKKYGVKNEQIKK